MASERDVAVIGAGIVGTCCALYLQREGYKVCLIDKGAPGEGASYGNAGNLGFASCVPAALPGVIKKVPRMLFSSEAPLKMRWGHVPSATGWFLRFIANARPERVEAIADARQALLSRLHEGYDPLLADADAGHLVNYSGLLMTWESEEAFAGARYALDIRRRRGVPMDELDGNEARQIEPALTPTIKKAVHFPRLAHVVNPLGLTQAFVRHFERRGGTVIREEAKGFDIGPNGPTHVVTDRGRHAATDFVIAAGVWSRPLAAALGTKVPLEAERGYHTMFLDPGIKLRVAVMSADRYIAATHMQEGIRTSGVAEFAAPEAPPNFDNATMVRRQAEGLLPGLKTEKTRNWMGPRPSHPDSLPALGRSPRFSNVIFAFGHDHIGLALAGITGKIVGELMSGRPTSVDLAAYRPDRF